MKRWVKNIIVLFVVVVYVVALSGCVTEKTQVRVNALTEKIETLSGSLKDKYNAAESGDLSVSAAIDFSRYAWEEIDSARKELSELKKTNRESTKDMIGAVILSILGSLGSVRLWRGGINKRNGNNPQ